MKQILFLATLSVLTVGCGHAQVAPTSYQVALTYTAPVASGSWTGCTTAAPCTYVLSRITLASGTTSCPAANTGTPNYTPLNASSPVTGTSYTDASAIGLTVCYIAQTEQSSAVSGPSNTAGPFAVPASPLAPTLSGAESTAKASMQLPATAGSKGAPVLSAKLVPVY